MNKQLLKWILYQIDEEGLLTLVNATATKIKGFREITRSNLKVIKPQILNEMNKPNKADRVREGLLQHIKRTLNEDDLKNLREKSQEELTELITNNTYTLQDILIVLATGGEEQQLELAEQLFKALTLEETSAEHDDSLTSEESTDTDGETIASTLVKASDVEVQVRIQKLEDHLSRVKEKNNTLQTAIRELRAKRKTESQEWRKERNTYLEEIKQFKTETETKSTELEQQKVLIYNLNDEIKMLKQQINDLTTKLEIKNTVLISAITTPEVMQMSKTEVGKPRIILLGESIPSSIMRIPKFNIELISSSQLEEFLKQDNCGQAAEIWMLSFQFSSQKQRKVRNSIEHTKFMEFATISELQTYVNKK